MPISRSTASARQPGTPKFIYRTASSIACHSALARAADSSAACDRSFGSFLAGASNFWAAGPTLLINVFDAGRRRAVKEQAVGFYNQSTANYRESVLSAFREVEDQLSTLRVLDEEARVQANAVSASERSLTLATNRYRGGVASYLEVITAQGFALANERTAVSILTRRMSATVLLLKDLGGGWNVSMLPVVVTK